MPCVGSMIGVRDGDQLFHNTGWNVWENSVGVNVCSAVVCIQNGVSLDLELK